MNLKMKHIRREKSGLFLYRRGIPANIQEHYDGKRFIVESLRTHDAGLAMNAAKALAFRDDALWASLRPWKPRSAEIEAQEGKAFLQFITRSREKEKGPTLSDARSEYEKKHTGAKARNDIALSFNFAVAVIGNRHLSELKRADGKAVLEAMLAKGWKSATVLRRMAILSAMAATGLLEFEVDARNAFSKLTVPDLFRDAKDVLPFTADELRAIAAACLLDGEDSLIAGVQLMTGLRVAEAAFLQVADIDLSASVPHLIIRENARRRLKNRTSDRKIPLVSISLEAGRKALQLATGPGRSSPWLFPETAGRGNDTASARVNKWLGKVLGGCPHSHQFRHSVETRLRNAGVPQPVCNAILGHAGKDKIPEGYFAGYSLEVLRDALDKITIR